MTHPSKKNSPLQTIRFICALLIFLHHWPYYDQNPVLSWLNTSVFTYFYSPVTFFFVLSGWSLMQGYYNKYLEHTFEFAAFIQKRLIKLYPIHWATFLIYFSLIQLWASEIHPSTTVANLLLVHAFSRNPDVSFSYNGVSWCLSIFLFLYLLFPVYLFILSRIHRFMQNFSWIVLLATVGGLFTWIYANTFPLGTPYELYFSPFERIIDFSVGVCLFFIVQKCKNFWSTNTVFWTTIEILALVCIIDAHGFIHLIPEKYTWDAYFILPWAFIIGVFAIGNGFISRLLASKKLPLLGNISLEFFMLHLPVLNFVYFWVNPVLQLNTIYSGLLSLGLTFLGSIILHWLVGRIETFPYRIKIVRI